MARVATTTDAPAESPLAASSGAVADPTLGSSSRVTLLGRTLDGRPLPRVRRRLTPLAADRGRLVGWLAPLVVTFLAGVLHFWNITEPHQITFDETYYAKDAYSLLVKGYASTFVNDDSTDESEADAIINSGSTEGIFGDDPSMVVHPEVGKWMIAFGEKLFGLTPLGWRFSAAVIGTLMVLVMCRLVRRLTGSTFLGCVAGVLLTLDGLHFVMSRIALLDIFLAFWLLCAVACLAADRDWARAKLARTYERSPAQTRGFGPVRGLLFRPWRIGAGVCFGLAAGVKWSAIFVIAGFALLMWGWDTGMRRSIGVRFAAAKSFVVDMLPAAVSVLLVGVVVYTASWVGLLTNAQKFEDQFGHANDANDWTWSSVDDDPQGLVGHALHDLNILWNYHIEVFKFHTGDYIKDATHPFQSDPLGWLLLNRPLGVAATSGDNDVIADCPPGESCVQQILAIGTPLLWWSGVIALLVGLGYWLSRRDWRFGIPVVGVLTTWLPWARYDDRPIFFYYGIAIVPFTVIALTLVIGKMLGPPDASRHRRLVGAAGGAALVAAIAINFVWFYPILTNSLLTNEEWNHRMWLTHWL